MNTVEELTNLTSTQLLIKLDELRPVVVKLGHQVAEADKRYHDLKELMPSILAEFQQLYSEDKSLKPYMVKIKALADKDYQGKIKEMNELEYRAKMISLEYRGYIESIKALTAIGYVRNSELKIER